MFSAVFFLCLLLLLLLFCHHSNWSRQHCLHGRLLPLLNTHPASLPAGQPASRLASQSLFRRSQLLSTVTSVKEATSPSTQDDIFVDEPSHSPIVSEVSAASLSSCLDPPLPSQNHFACLCPCSCISCGRFPGAGSTLHKRACRCDVHRRETWETGDGVVVLSQRWLPALWRVFRPSRVAEPQLARFGICRTQTSQANRWELPRVSASELFLGYIYFLIVPFLQFTPEESGAAELSQPAVYRQSCSHRRLTGYTLPAQSRQRQHTWWRLASGTPDACC